MDLRDILTASAEVHWVLYGVVPVYTECHKDIGGRVCDNCLRVSHYLTCGVASFPRHWAAPHDVGEYAQYSHTQIWNIHNYTKKFSSANNILKKKKYGFVCHFQLSSTILYHNGDVTSHPLGSQATTHVHCPHPSPILSWVEFN